MKSMIAFIAGISTGIGIGLYLGHEHSKKRYERLADNEVESVKKSLKEYYETNYTRNKPSEEKKESNSVKKDISKDDKLKQVITNKNSIAGDADVADYKDYAGVYQSPNTPERIPGIPKSKTNEREISEDDQPYQITEEEYMESHYEAVTLFYYRDRVLADDDYNIINDIPGHIGSDNVLEQLIVDRNRDSIYIRNDRLAIDYEVLFDEREYYKLNNRLLRKDPDGMDGHSDE